MQTLELTEPLPLSPVESVFWKVGETLAGAGRVWALFRLDGCVEDAPLVNALRHLQCRHPKLRAVVSESSERRLYYYFQKEPPPIPYEIKDYDGEEPPWREEANRVLQMGFPAAGPLAAIVVFRNRSRSRSDLILSLHHAIVDGLSTMTLVDDLLTEYARAEGNTDAPPRPELSPVTALRAKADGGWLGKLRLLRHFLRNQKQEQGTRYTPLPQAQGIPPRSQWENWLFSRSDTLRLVRSCRENQASMAGVLAAAVCYALVDALGIASGVFKCQFPIDIRKSLEGTAGPITPQDLGCFASIMNRFLETRSEPAAFWETAREIQKAIQTFVESGGPSATFNMIGNDLTKWASPKVGAASKRPTLFSNFYGVMNISDRYGSLRPRECILTFNSGEVGPLLHMEAAVLGQQLNVGLSAGELEPAFWEGVRTAFRRRLEFAIRAV